MKVVVNTILVWDDIKHEVRGIRFQDIWFGWISIEKDRGWCKTIYKGPKSMLKRLSFVKKVYQGFCEGGLVVNEMTIEVSETKKTLDVFGIMGVDQSSKVSIILGSMPIPWAPIQKPINSTSDQWNSHFSSLANNLYCWRRLSTVRAWWWCKVGSSESIRMSSR